MPFRDGHKPVLTIAECRCLPPRMRERLELLDQHIRACLIQLEQEVREDGGSPTDIRCASVAVLLSIAASNVAMVAAAGQTEHTLRRAVIDAASWAESSWR